MPPHAGAGVAYGSDVFADFFDADCWPRHEVAEAPAAVRASNRSVAAPAPSGPGSGESGGESAASQRAMARVALSLLSEELCPRIPAASLLQRCVLAQALLVDTRPAHELATLRLQNAVHVPIAGTAAHTWSARCAELARRRAAQRQLFIVVIGSGRADEGVSLADREPAAFASEFVRLRIPYVTMVDGGVAALSAAAGAARVEREVFVTGTEQA